MTRRGIEPELSLSEFYAALSAEMEKSPTIVSEQVAAAQSRQARRSRRDAIIAERGRLYEASIRLVAGEMAKITPTMTTTLAGHVKRRDARERDLDEVRREWWRSVDEMWPVPPNELHPIRRGLVWVCVVGMFVVFWVGMIVAGLFLFRFFMR